MSEGAAGERMEGKKTRTKILPAGSLKSKVMLLGRSIDVCLADGNRAGLVCSLGNSLQEHLFFFFFLAPSCSLWDLSSLNGD